MSNTPMVSVLMPVYNRDTLVSEALQSVLNQTFEDYEVVVVDDGSTDESRKVIASFSADFKGRLVQINFPVNRGVIAALNSALDAARGEFIAYLDSDDLWLPMKLESQVAFMQRNSDVVYSFHDVEFFDSRSGECLGLVSEIVGRGRGRLEGGGVERLFDLRVGLSTPAQMFRRSAIADCRYESVAGIGGYEFLFEVSMLARGGKIGVINEVLARYRKHEKNLSRSISSLGQSMQDMLVACAVLDARYPRLTRQMVHVKRHVVVTEVVRCFLGGDMGRAKDLSLAAFYTGAGAKPLVIFWLYRLFYKRIAGIVQSFPVLARFIANRIYR